MNEIILSRKKIIEAKQSKDFEGSGEIRTSILSPNLVPGTKYEIEINVRKQI